MSSNHPYSPALYAEMIVSVGDRSAKVLAVRLKPALAEALADKSLTTTSAEVFGPNNNGRMCEKMKDIIAPEVFFRPEAVVTYRVTDRMGQVFDPDTHRRPEGASTAREAAEAMFEKRSPNKH